MCTTCIHVQRGLKQPIQRVIQIEILLFISVDEDQTVQRIQSDPDLHLLLTVIYKW